MYERIEKKEVELKKTIANDLKQATIARKQLNEDKEMLNEMADDLDDYYNEITGQITLHMLKFSQNWNDKQSKKLFTALELGKPQFGMRNGVNILIATQKLNDLQNILRLLAKLEEKAEELEKAHKAELMAQQLIADEAEQMAQQLIAEEESTKKKEKKKKKKKKKTKKKKPTDKEPATQGQAPAAAPAKAAAAAPAKAETPRQAPSAAAAPAKAETPKQAPSAAAKEEEDPFKIRIEDIQSYLDEKGIDPKKEENTEFINHKEAILGFVRDLNLKLAKREYTLIITGGYAINLHGGKNKTSDVDMVLCHNDNVQRVRAFITSQIFELMGEKKMDVRVLQLAPGTDVNDPTNPVKIRINGVQAIDITFKNNTNNFCKEIELIGGFFVLEKDFMKRNLIEITNDFREKLDEGVISHPGKLVSWLHQMTSLNKLLNPRSRTSSPTLGGVRKTRRRKKKRKKRKKSRKKKK